MIRVYDDAGNVIETHEHTDYFQRAVSVMRDRAIEAAVSESIGLRLAISG